MLSLFRYDHVATRLRTTDVLTPKPSHPDFTETLRALQQGNNAFMTDLEQSFMREASIASLASHDAGLLTERLKTFEATCLSLGALNDPSGIKFYKGYSKDEYDSIHYFS